MKITKERAEELSTAWNAANSTERLRLNRTSWIAWGEDVDYFEEEPSALELKAADRIEELEDALSWYGEQARLCRLVHSEGDAGRNALATDGGKRAREVLTATET